MTSRYFNRTIGYNASEQYAEILRKRNVPYIDQYNTPDIKSLTVKDLDNLSSVSHVWSMGDRFYKLADSYYKDPKLWWVIAWYNQMPTEAHVQIGWIVSVPLPLEEALRLWDK